MKILSGVFEDARTGGQVTTGTPISMIIENVDQRPRDYSDIATRFRPGHADYAYFAKYGVRDYRGGGRQSARETAARVAAGAIARKILGEAITVRAAISQIGPYTVDRARWDWAEVANNNQFCAGSADGCGLGVAPGEDPQDRLRPIGAIRSRSRRWACRPAGARRSTASWTANSPAR